MPSEKEMMKQFKHDFPEEYERQEKLAQEIIKGIPEMGKPNFFGTELSRRNAASPTAGLADKRKVRGFL